MYSSRLKFTHDLESSTSIFSHRTRVANCAFVYKVTDCFKQPKNLFINKREYTTVCHTFDSSKAKTNVKLFKFSSGISRLEMIIEIQACR